MIMIELRTGPMIEHGDIKSCFKRYKRKDQLLFLFADKYPSRSLQCTMCAYISVADMKGSVKQVKQDFYGKHKWLLGKQGQAGHWPRL